MNTILAGFQNWKTTLAGCGIAVLTAYTNGGFTNLRGTALAVAIGSVVLGFLSKDGTKTGAPE